MALYSPYSNIRPRFSEYDELPDGEPVYSQGLLSPTATPTATPTAYPDAGQQVPQVRSSATPEAERLARLEILKRLQAGEQVAGWSYSPGEVSASFGDGSGSGGTSSSFHHDISPTQRQGYDEQGNLSGSVFEPGAGYRRMKKWEPLIYAGFASLLGPALFEGLVGAGGTGAGALTGVDAAMADLAASGGLTASSMAPAAAGSALGSTALTGVDAAMADLAASGGLTPASMASAAVPTAAELGLPAAAAPTNLTPAAMESLLGTPGYGVNAAAQGVAQAAGMDVGLVGSGAALPFESIGSLAPSPSTASETFRPSDNYGDGMSGAQTGTYDKVLEATGSKTAADLATTVASPFDAFKTWSAANPMLSKLLFSGATSLLSTSGGGGDSKGGYVDSGYRPTISRGGFQARVPTAPTNGPTGLLNPSIRPVNLPSTGQANDGLWRYGLLGPGRG